MSSILVDHPLGLGDHLICSGIVRAYADHYERVGLFCLPANAPSVSFLYRDLPQVTIHPIRDHAERKRIRLLTRLHLRAPHYDRIKTVAAPDPESGVMFEKQLYNTAGVPLEKKWDNFYVERDQHRERALEDKYPPLKDFMFLHDDSRFPIDRARIAASLPIITPNLAYTDTLFDYCGLLMRAREIHVMDSSFMFLVDLLPEVPGQQLFVHRYTRPNMAWNLPILKKAWNILA